MSRATATQPTTTTVLAITALFGGALTAPTARRRRQATMMATVTPFAEDHFHDGYALHKCHVQPEDSSQMPFQAHCHAMEISADSQHMMEVSLRADTVDDDEPVIANAIPANSADHNNNRNKPATAVAVDVSGTGHCVMPWRDVQTDDPGHSCGGRTILHMRLQFDDDGPSYCDEACVAATMWTRTAPDGRATNADKVFRASSYSQTYFEMSRSRVVTVRIPGSVNDYAPGFPGANPSTGCPHYSLVALAKQHLPSDIHIAEYQHHAYWLPLTRVLGCDWDGLASIRGHDTLYRGNDEGLVAHELGHNLGLGHSGVDANDDGVAENEYGDKGGVMGTALDGPPGFIGLHRMLLGWIADGHGLYREPALSCAAHHELQITLSRLDHAPTTASHTNPHGKTLVTFPRTSATDRYYLSFYSEHDFNGDRITPHWRNQVHVHSYSGRGENSKHVAKLSELAQTFSGSSMGEAFEITVLNIGADSATVWVFLPGCQPTAMPTPSPTPAPTTPAPTMPPTPAPTPAASATNADSCPPGYVNSPKRYNMAMGRITIVHFDMECSDRCAQYSGIRFNGGCKGYMTGMYYRMKFCRSYGGNAQTQRCAPWATPSMDGQCCTREVVNTVPPL